MEVKFIILLVTVGACSVFSDNGVESGIMNFKEDKEIERRFPTVKKQAVKTIQTIADDIFDCVSIYKQPAFDHPALVNHTIQMKPSSFPTENINESSETERRNIGLPEGGCPDGTVPIRRVSADEMTSISSISDFSATSHHIPNTPSFPDFHYALIEANSGRAASGNMYGAKGYINIFNVSCNGDQQSRGAIWVLNGDIETRNGVVAGWIAYPKLYGDSQTRLFASWMDVPLKRGCFNTLCPGFVQVSKQIPLGITCYASIIGGPQFELRLKIYKDRQTQNWWLLLADEPVGYWPSSIFSFFNHASTIHFGGAAYGYPSPPMGSGLFPYRGFTYAASMKLVEVVNEANEFQPPSKGDAYADNTKCYNVGYEKYRGGSLGYSFLFGGPGGLCGA